MTEYPDHIAIARKLLDRQGEINALTERAEKAEALLQALGWEKCAPCGNWVEPLGMVLHFRAEHATAENLAESGTDDVCQVIEVDGGPIRIHGQGELTEEGTAALAAVVATAKRLMAMEPPGPLDFKCPRCGAVPGQMCRRESGMGGRAPHDERKALARQAAEACTRELRIKVTAPTPADAERWAGGIRDMVAAEFGDSMRLDISIGEQR